MSLAIVPGIFIMILLLFSPGNQTTPSGTGATAQVAATETFDDHPAIDVEAVQIEDNADYRAIYSFITQKYTKISTNDADIIAKNLVVYGKENQVDPKFAAALMARESAFNRTAVSATGAKGLGQIKDFNYKSLDIQDPFDIQQNTRGTVTYLKQMLKTWKSESKKASLALASYFKGHNAIARQNKMVDSTTKNYVADIISNYNRISELKSVAMAPSVNISAY